MANNDMFVHKTSIVDDEAVVGSGTKLWAFSHIMNGAVVGNGCSIGEHVYIESGVILGNGVKVKNHISLYSGVVCEDDVFLGPACVFTNVTTPRSFISRKDKFKGTLIRKGASIGGNATIICGNIIGEYAMIAAGAVVTKDIPAYALMAGIPAKQIGWVCECGEVLDETLLCSTCGRRYQFVDEQTLTEIR